MKYFSFRKIYRYTINDDFKYLEWINFLNRFNKFTVGSDKLIFKLEPINLTKKHKYEIKRLLSGLDLNDDKQTEQKKPLPSSRPQSTVETN